MSAFKGSIFVTGANGGLGSAIAEQIASKPEFAGYCGIYAVRDANAAPSLAAALSRGDSSRPHDVLSLDLTSLENVRRVAEDVNTRVASGQVPPIRALILNAGFHDFGNQSLTENGLDTVFAANYLGHWLLTMLLLKSIDKVTGRIVILGSQAHDPEDPRNASTGVYIEPYRTLCPTDAAGFDAVATGTWSSAQEDSTWRGGARRYSAANLFKVMAILELQRRLDKDPALSNVCVLGVDPGTMVTGLQSRAPFFIRVILFKLIFPFILWLKPDGGTVRPLHRSAADVLEAAFGEVSKNGALPKALYFDGRAAHETSQESKDAVKRELVWKETVRYTDLKERDTILANWK